MTKKWIALPVAAIVAVGVVACADEPTGLAPQGPNYELVEIGTRVEKDDVNARVWLSFAIPFEVEVEGGTGEVIPVAQPDGAALNFPGNENNAGTCEGGTWKNKNGKGMGGTDTKPHPHCTIYVDAGGGTVETVYVVLEPISAEYVRQNANQWRLAFTNEGGDNGKVLVKNNEQLKGNGQILAWAVFQEDPDQRVGQISFDLGQFDDSVWDNDVCEVSDKDDLPATSCLAQLIDFSYQPIGEADGGYGLSGFGIADTYEAAGFLWWESVGPGWTRDD